MFFLLFVLYLFCIFCFIFCVVRVFVSFCVLFLLMHIFVSFTFVYQFTDHCQRVETKLQLMFIVLHHNLFKKKYRQVMTQCVQF
jgi:hypothetical protein